MPMVDIMTALTDAKDELVSKDAEIATLKEQFKRSAETIEIAGFKYDKTGDGKPKGKAYCPVCERKSGLLMHLTRIQGKDVCPNCKAAFERVMIFAD
jgi:CRISPR/Cas system-associated protein Cas10 (large subunit of type III CRISPR-Cas system)